MSKTIQINPDLFTLSAKSKRSHRKTEKARPSSDSAGSEIKIKNPLQDRKKTSKTIRRDLLRFIRKQQEKNFKHLIQNDQNIIDKKDGETEFNGDFDESLKYLMEIAKQNEPEREMTPKNHTFRNMQHNEVMTYPDLLDVGLPDDLQTTVSNAFKDQNISYRYSGSEPGLQPVVPQPTNVAIPSPSYGCLKGGQLPTYRNYHNMTQKIRPPPSNVHPFVQNAVSTPPISSEVMNPSYSEPTSVKEYVPIHSPQFISNVLEEAKQKARERAKRVVSEVAQGIESQKHGKKRSNLRYLKQRKTIRRTYAVGKSRFQPKVGVLISNKTIRNNITTQSQLLKQTPITEVRSYLMKKGFIKIGTAAPNDVLRKMYESVFLICGDVENHNGENLLYNYFNDKS